MRYKYKIEIDYINPETSTVVPIETQCIQSLAIDRNYEKCNIPVALLTLNLNKNLIDDMILNVNKNRLNISLYKFSLDGDQTPEKVFSEQFVYSTDKDINYHKDIDYNDTETEQNGGKKREDILDNIKLGVMCKKNLDNKAHYVNKIVNNCTVEECIIQEFQGMDILIEPFENATKKSTIIITPTETYQKLLEKLNKIDGFYSTPFRFFMDYDIAYLLSSSGKATKAKNETYSNVNIDIRTISDPNVDAYAPGVEIDNEHKCYKIPIASDNSTYKMNNVTSKIQNDIKAVIDVSKEVKSKNASAKSVMQKLNMQKNKIDQVVKSNINRIASVGNDLNSIGRGLENDIKIANRVNNKLGNILNIADGSFGPWSKHKCLIGEFHSIGEALEDIMGIKQNISDLKYMVTTLPNEFKGMKDKLFSTAHRTMNLSSFLDCVTELHYNDNINGADDLCNKILVDSTDNIRKVNESNYNKTADLYDRLNRKSQSITSIISQIPDHFKMRQDGTDPEPDDPPEELIDVDLTEDKAKIIQLFNEDDYELGGNIHSALSTCSSNFNNNVISMLNTQGTSKDIANGCSGSIKNVMNTPNNLGDEFKGGSISLYENTISKATDAKTNISNAITLNKDSISSYGSDVLNNIKSDINSLGNLNDIGSLGLSEVDTNISIDGKELLKDETKKITMLRVPNDNVNILKQESAKIKLTSSVLTLNKYDLDTQIFTPNKSYTVSNFDSHSSRDGQFILALKKEVYRREDDVFRLTSILTFRKALD